MPKTSKMHGTIRTSKKVEPFYPWLDRQRQGREEPTVGINETAMIFLSFVRCPFSRGGAANSSIKYVIREAAMFRQGEFLRPKDRRTYLYM